MKKNITIFLILAGFAASYLNGMEWGDLNLTEEEIENAKVARLKPEEIAKGRTLKLKLQEMIEAKNSGATLEYMAEQKKNEENIQYEQKVKVEEEEAVHEEAMRNIEKEEQDRELAAQLQEKENKTQAPQIEQNKLSETLARQLQEEEIKRVALEEKTRQQENALIAKRLQKEEKEQPASLPEEPSSPPVGPQSRTSKIYEGTKKRASIPLDKVKNFIQRVTTPTIYTIINSTERQLNKAFEPLINELKKEDRYNLDFKGIIARYINEFMGLLKGRTQIIIEQIDQRKTAKLSSLLH